MKEEETSGRRDTRSDVSAQHAQRGRRNATEPQSPSRRLVSNEGGAVPQHEQWKTHYDDSFSEERLFISPTSLQLTGSWESSQSFDEELRSTGARSSSRPSSRSEAARDRRKQFDSTTPTLIDEDDEPLPREARRDGEEAEIISLEHARIREFSAADTNDESGMRRTPGASMYKSTFESTTAASEVASMRRTPGASAMHRSAVRKDPEGSHEKASATGLGFGLTLSTPVGGNDRNKAPNTPMWETVPSQSASQSPTTRPPRAPASAAESAGPTHEPRGPFSFAPWTTRSTRSPTVSGETPDGRHGAFSPTTMRLKEDIGNLLHEDEDDDYALELPSVFRSGDSTSGEGLSDFGGGDWTGSYVFDRDFGGRRSSRPAVPRPSALVKEGKARRRSPPGSQQFPNAQQPKPRRSNEVFEFGKSKAADEQSSTNVFNFGGAFAPPTKDTATSFAYQPNLTQQPCQQERQQQYTAGIRRSAPQHQYTADFRRPEAAMMHTQSFVPNAALKARPVAQPNVPPPNEAYMQPPGYTSPSPSYGMHPSPQYFLPQSEMQATAREFVPMATRGPTIFTTGQQTWQHAPQIRFDAGPMDQSNWHAQNYAYAAGNYAYGIPSPGLGDARAGMTPSPHLQGWQHSDPNMLTGMPLHQMETGMHPPYMVAPGAHLATASQEHSYRDVHRGKKETKRGKRGKKKSQKNEAANTSRKPAASTKKKKESARPSSATQGQDGQGGDALACTSEDPADVKRADSVDSPSTRIAFKDFYRSFRGEERLSFQKAEEFAFQVLEDGSLPESVHWRVYLELADLAKRSNRYVEARQLYQKVCRLRPYASQGWLEYSKLEEECGHMNRVTNILHAGLEYCEYSESLLTRAVKHQEKLGNLSNGRALLARLKHVGIDKVWRTVLEGALLEARAGNTAMSRRVLKYLMHHVPWYGPLYLEAYRLERDQGHLADALQVVERGLQAIPRYGPLWFGAFRLCEEMDMLKKNYDLPTTMEMIARATLSISKELVWKVHLEAAQMLERSALEQAREAETEANSLFKPARNHFALTILTCPHNLRWKVWLAAARMELGIGNREKSRALFFRAHQVVPEKGRSSTLLECARLEEFIGDSSLARAVLCKGRVEYGHDWKVWLEAVLLEIRCGNFSRAIEIVTSALEIHYGTGRLWAALVQLSQFHGGDEAQNVALRRALNAVPKSGEVWCEGGRIHLNPFSDTFNLNRARRHLTFATRFTPQFGDSFVETLRLELLVQWLSPIADYIWEQTKESFLAVTGPADGDCLTKYITDVSLAVSVACQKESEVKKGLPHLVHRDIVATVRKRLKPDFMKNAIDLSDLRLACTTADPNYGSLWFHCRRVPTDTPRKVIEDAAEDVADELHTHARVYIAALVRRMAVLAMIEGDKPPNADREIEIHDAESAEWEVRVDEKLRTTPSLKEIFNPLDPTTGLGLLESTISGPDFATALSELNRHRTIESMSFSDRKKILFGTDALFP